MMQIALRILAVLCAVAVGWSAQMIGYLLIASGAGPLDIRFWASWSALYCAFALIFVAVPVAIWKPPAVTARPVRSILLAGCAGALIALTPPALGMLFLTVPLGFLVGAMSMWAYVALLGLLPGVFGSE